MESILSNFVAIHAWLVPICLLSFQELLHHIWLLFFQASNDRRRPDERTNQTTSSHVDSSIENRENEHVGYNSIKPQTIF